MSPALIAIPTGFSFRHKFEEVPLFWQYTGNEAWRTGRIDGEFEVTVERNGDWIITEVMLAVDNGKIGPEAKGHLLTLDADTDERFYLLALDAIYHRYSSYIDEMIADEAAERGLRIAA